MTMGSLYNGKQFPEYIFTDKVKSYLFVDFDMVFVDRGFWQKMKSILESAGVRKMTVKNLDPDYFFEVEIDVMDIPEAYLRYVQDENLDGYFSVSANLHMVTIKTLIYTHGEGNALCILLDRDYGIGIVGFSSSKKPEILTEYEITLSDYLKLSFAGKGVPGNIEKAVIENWKLPVQ